MVTWPLGSVGPGAVENVRLAVRRVGAVAARAACIPVAGHEFGGIGGSRGQEPLEALLTGNGFGGQAGRGAGQGLGNKSRELAAGGGQLLEGDGGFAADLLGLRDQAGVADAAIGGHLRL